MKIYQLLFTLILCTVSYLNVNAQQDSILNQPYQPVVNVDSLMPAIRFVEKMPEFPGGTEGFSMFLAREIIYPEVCRQIGITGVVILEFIVEKDGSLSNINVIVPVYPDLDNEAVRVIKKSPNWKPGLHLGKPVRVYYQVPIRFRLID